MPVSANATVETTVIKAPFVMTQPVTVVVRRRSFGERISWPIVAVGGAVRSGGVAVKARVGGHVADVVDLVSELIAYDIEGRARRPWSKTHDDDDDPAC